MSPGLFNVGAIDSGRREALRGVHGVFAVPAHLF